MVKREQVLILYEEILIANSVGSIPLMKIKKAGQ
jgi:hypothetical protein